MHACTVYVPSESGRSFTLHCAKGKSALWLMSSSDIDCCVRLAYIRYINWFIVHIYYYNTIPCWDDALLYAQCIVTLHCCWILNNVY